MGDRRRKGKEPMSEYEYGESSRARRTRARMEEGAYGGRTDDSTRPAGSGAGAYGGGTDYGNRPAGSGAGVQFAGTAARDPPAPDGGRQPPAARGRGARPSDMVRISEYGLQSQWPTRAPQQTLCPLCGRSCLNGVCLRCVTEQFDPEKLYGPLRIGGGGGGAAHNWRASVAEGSRGRGFVTGNMSRQAQHVVVFNPVPENRRCPACRWRSGRTVSRPREHTCVCVVCLPLAGRRACQVCGHAAGPSAAQPQHPLPHGRGHPRPPQHQAPPVPPRDFGLCELCGLDPARPRRDPVWHGCSCEMCYLYDDRPCKVCGRRGFP